MGGFSDAEDVYETLGRLFAELIDDPELGPRFQGADTVLRQVFHDPEAEITVDLRRDRDPEVAFGPSADLVAEVTMEMDADVAHRFWQGEVNVITAIARGQIETTGPVGKVLRLVPLTPPVYPRYRALLAALGRLKLVEN